ncbi:dihydroxyacetone kinase phosphoryl donor subunit DhaM [Vagococcus elongatus]|uniref:phosphoenolpyruvate--glycerone phosphotransferase n=1 Tax=Vagococcus elongatus TaxID=180344 RepID=A0A430B1R5_9ENTE|nr:dihydroxyacetone kinase phosphoryl donor subunit DhaM [Vagococcus elongatus]RSU14273.1 PTS mannose family transporter subunit IIA [Vagococcus elongatus]
MAIGIVIVSHVAEIAAGLKRLVKEVAADVPITTAGGTDDGGVGTSFEKIMKAFEENPAETILAFYDLGSAKMNLEMAMEMTEKEVKLYDTAMIESCYTAAALAQAGVELDAIDQQLKPLKVK